MTKQFEFPFKKDLEKEKIIGKTIEGEMPTPSELGEYDNTVIGKGGKLTSPERNKQAAEKAFDEILERKKNKEQHED